jgi:hypothetical protein
MVRQKTYGQTEDIWSDFGELDSRSDEDGLKDEENDDDDDEDDDDKKGEFLQEQGLEEEHNDDDGEEEYDHPTLARRKSRGK